MTSDSIVIRFYLMIRFKSDQAASAYLQCQMVLPVFPQCSPSLCGWVLNRSPVLLIHNQIRKCLPDPIHKFH